MKTKIYLLPGFMCDQRLFAKLEVLLSEYELITLALPLAENLEQMITLLHQSLAKEERINLLGFSFGGYLAAAYALAYPKQVKRLMLLSATPCAMSEVEIRKRKQALTLIKKFGFKELSGQVVKNLLEKEDEELITLIKDMYKGLGEKQFLSQMHCALEREDLFLKLDALTMPILLCFAKNDSMLIHDKLEAFEQNSSQIYFKKLQGKSHFLPLEKPQESAQMIKTWLNLDVAQELLSFNRV